MTMGESVCSRRATLRALISYLDLRFLREAQRELGLVLRSGP